MAKRIDIAERRDARGREASRPREISRAGWRDILLRTRKEMTDDNLGLVAAGVAFYTLFAIFPAMAAMIAIYGVVADPADVERQISAAMGILPAQAAGLLQGQLRQLVSQPSGGLSVAALFGILIAVWSAAKGMKALMQGLNIVYDEREQRGFIKLNAIALLLTVGALVFGLLALSLIAVAPPLLQAMGLPGWLHALASLGRWPILLAAVMVGLAVIYRYAPCRDKPRWAWTSTGAVAATLVWLVASIGFSVYVANFGNYSATYGSLGAVVILMTWFYLSSYLVLAGAEINAEMERQTRRDTTEGQEQPMGQRHAHVADEVGREP